jgi:hypothetical protein
MRLVDTKVGTWGAILSTVAMLLAMGPFVAPATAAASDGCSHLVVNEVVMNLAKAAASPLGGLSALDQECPMSIQTVSGQGDVIFGHLLLYPRLQDPSWEIRVQATSHARPDIKWPENPLPLQQLAWENNEPQKFQINGAYGHWTFKGRYTASSPLYENNVWGVYLCQDFANSGECLFSGGTLYATCLIVRNLYPAAGDDCSGY